MALEQKILSAIRKAKAAGRAHPTSKRLYGLLSERGVFDSDVDNALRRMRDAGTIRISGGCWFEVGDLSDTRKPKGPKKVDPKSAEARTLPLEFFK